MESNAPNLLKQLHALLFSEGGALTLKKIKHLTGAADAQVMEALSTLRQTLEGTGLTVVQSDTEVSLVIAADTAPSVQSALEREFSAEIGDAGLEVLAIVLYRGPSTRAQIDYIRGVNTSTTIRSLLSRGLLERTGNPDDGREFLYRPTVELLAHVGARTASELPDYENVVAELKAFESTAPAITSQQTDDQNAQTP